MKQTFDEMITRLTPTLKRITHKLNGHFTFFDDSDLMQEALTHLWLRSRDKSLYDKTDSYILQGCYFHLKNYIRKTMDKGRLISLYAMIDGEEATLGEMLAAEDTSFDGIDEKLLIEKAVAAGLTPREQKVLTLSLDGRTIREIGTMLGVSHVMVMKIKERIKERLKGKI